MLEIIAHVTISNGKCISIFDWKLSFRTIRNYFTIDLTDVWFTNWAENWPLSTSRFLWIYNPVYKYSLISISYLLQILLFILWAIFRKSKLTKWKTMQMFCLLPCGIMNSFQNSLFMIGFRWNLCCRYCISTSVYLDQMQTRLGQLRFSIASGNRKIIDTAQNK